MANPLHLERGNIFFMILLGVVLFAALSAALIKTSTGGKDISGDKAKLLADQIMRYSADVKAGVNRLYLNGVSEADIRFAHPKMPSAYGTITTNPQNQVFSETGGGVTYMPVPAGAQSTVVTWQFSMANRMQDVGVVSKPDLTIVAPYLKQSVCEAINYKLGYAKGLQPQDNGDCLYWGESPADPNMLYTGTEVVTGGNLAGNHADTRLPAYQACFKCAGANEYHYVNVLIER